MHKRAKWKNIPSYLPLLFLPLIQNPFSKLTSVKPIAKNVICEEILC